MRFRRAYTVILNGFLPVLCAVVVAMVAVSADPTGPVVVDINIADQVPDSAPGEAQRRPALHLPPGLRGEPFSGGDAFEIQQ